MQWLKSLFGKRALDDDLDRELRFHIDELTRENIARGMTREEAHRQAILAFGGREQMKQGLRDVHRLPMADRVAANLRSAMRFLRKSPSFSAVVIATLGLGIGANSAVFSAIDAVLLRPMPFPHGNELMRVEQLNPRTKTPATFLAPTRLEDWNRLSSTFQGITGYYTQDVSETSGVLPEKVTEALVAPRFLQIWGVAPALGRDFAPEEEHFGGPEAVLISDRLWQRQFHGDPGAVGKNLHLGKSSPIIVGIMPASFRFPEHDVDIWTPSPLDFPAAQNRDDTWYTAIGRLKPGVTVDQARADLQKVQAQLALQYPKTDAQILSRVEPLKEVTVGGGRRSLWILFGAVSLLLLIACTNIAALLLARTTEREHEISIRFALGASRAAVISQLLTEVFVLTLVGAAVGLFIAGESVRLFHTLAKALPRVEEIHLDWRIVVYSLVCSVAVTLLCGLLPALRGTRSQIAGALASAGRTQVGSRHRVQWLLVGVQVALAVTLLVSAGLLLRSFQELTRVSPGFEYEHVLTLRISANWGETADMKGLTQRIDRTLDTLRNAPGVEAAATAGSIPGVPNLYQSEMKISEGAPADGRHVLADNRFVSPGYFGTMRIPLLSGEFCRQSGSHLVVAVNRKFADTYFPSSSAIGHHMQMLGSSFPLIGEVLGIVGDAREEGLNTEPEPTVYWCTSAPVPDPYYLVRTTGEPAALTDPLRRKIHEIEPGRSVFDIIPLAAHLDDTFAENRLRTILLTLFALTAILLASIGIYGTLSYFVSVRHREVGLRLALGALRRQIVMRFLMQGLRVSLLGCLAGIALAALSARLLAGMLYGVSSLDPATFAAVIVLVLGVGTLASLLPSFRAAAVNPIETLREE